MKGEKEEDEREKDEDERDDDAARLQSVISLLLHSRKCSFLNLDLTTIPAYKIHGESILSTMMSTIRDSMGLVLKASGVHCLGVRSTMASSLGSLLTNIGALMIRIMGPLYYNSNKVPPPNSISLAW